MSAIILLAAGSSSRLGQPKQLLPFKGKTLLRRAAETAVEAAAGAPVVVVTGALHEELLPELVGLPVMVVQCKQWQAGMGASIKTGLQALEMHARPLRGGVTVMLCDQPFVTTSLLQQLAAAATPGQPIAASQYNEVWGVPVFFGVEALPLLRLLPDAAGAAQLLRQHPELVVSLPFPLGAVDVDTPEQYAALLASPG
ncbi:molybdenum cofactor cytidylyltransferase [Hymenobacter gelipurpurascens]|uniref:Molybdenum cofactor cytidylyltransferase n=1 Tax=Hymenobacter gelipurpurascens TaxID=89968 RepID=A0A212TJH3_9BACT|nr:nucleotidyltransferase family protein [Hymenobacter gelipurpurascens]SNC65984.1 molybdenum cofactor cytidylyltransferase [Hymenobacter gelipurpurascens]